MTCGANADHGGTKRACRWCRYRRGLVILTIVQTSTYLAVSLTGTDDALRLVAADEAARGVAHHSHKPTAPAASEACGTNAAEQSQTVVIEAPQDLRGSRFLSSK